VKVAQFSFVKFFTFSYSKLIHCCVILLLIDCLYLNKNAKKELQFLPHQVYFSGPEILKFPGKLQSYVKYIQDKDINFS
jgi:hypothetical protein